MAHKHRSIGRYIAMLNRQFQSYMTQEMKDYDLNFSECIYLAELEAHEGIHQANLSDLLIIDPALTTRVMKSLEKKGYIERRKELSDKRIILVYLSDQGKKITPLIIDKLSAWTDLLSAPFSEEETQQVYDALIKMTDTINTTRKDT